MPIVENWTQSRFLAVAALVLALGACGQPSAGPETSAGAAEETAPAPMTDQQKASYSIGYTMATNVQQRFADAIDVDAFVRGISDRLEDRERAVSIEEATAALQSFADAQAAALETRASDNLAAGSAFMSQNGAREGVVTLPSGLQYEVLVAADGPKPAASDTVTTHYHGTLIDGTVFDSSYDRGQPASFPLDGVISGWTEALQLMSVGAKYRLYVPPELAYGDQDRGPIPANSTLIFDVELIGIESGS